MATLVAENLDVSFGGLHALGGASLSVTPGHVTGLIGPNGAGKTTLFNAVTGMQLLDGGRVYIRDDHREIDLTSASVHRRARAGIARTFQKLEAFNSLSALDNVRVAVEMRRRWERSDRRDATQVATDLLTQVGIGDVADITVATLPTGTARLVELARALATAPRFLLLDEPSSGLNEEETGSMARLLAALVRSTDLAVLLVEHDMSFVMGVCDQIHVLDFGEIIAVGPPEEIRRDPAVQAAYLGTDA